LIFLEKNVFIELRECVLGENQVFASENVIDRKSSVGSDVNVVDVAHSEFEIVRGALTTDDESAAILPVEFGREALGNLSLGFNLGEAIDDHQFALCKFGS